MSDPDAVRLAIAAVKANPPHMGSPLPWTVDHGELSPPDVLCSAGLAVSVGSYGQDAACIAAAVNAAPVLVAEVERLQAQIEAARVAVGKWKPVSHNVDCPTYPGWRNTRCTCGTAESNAARSEARRALGLEGDK